MADIPSFGAYLSPSLLSHLQYQLRPVPGIDGLMGLDVNEGSCLETPEALRFLCEVYDRVKGRLNHVLEQRMKDRLFVDERTRACASLNTSLGIDFLDPEYATVIGQEDEEGRIVMGPKFPGYNRGPAEAPDETEGCRREPVAPIPSFLQGPHVTLFGPPDDAKLCVNAMNAYHRKLPGEPPVVEELLALHTSVPKWGADDEDSKTPMHEDLVSAALNLGGCFDKSITFDDPKSGKHYKLAEDKLSVPIKRFPGLALPCTFLFYRGFNPIPLHLYDFALHMFHHWKNPEALAFYVPKLENEEEAAYVRYFVEVTEQLLVKMHPGQFSVGTVRLLIVLENPRAIFRIHEIMDELYPYFAGASLGWHG